MTQRPVLFVLAAALGCSVPLDGAPCRSDENCPLDQTCSVPSGAGEGTCVVGSRGDAGLPGTCAPACTGSTFCAGTSCQPAFTKIEIVSPTDNSSVTTSGVELDVRITRAPGAPNDYPRVLTVSGTGEDSTTLDVELALNSADGQYLGGFGPPRGGNWTLTAKSPAVASPSAPVTVRINNCMDACSTSQVCVDAACQPAFTKLELVSPTEGAPVGAKGIGVSARLTRRQSSANWPATTRLLVVDSSSAQKSYVLAGDGTGTYTGKFTPTAAGTYTLKASGYDLGYDLVSTVVTIAADLTGPGLVLSVVTPGPIRAAHETDPEAKTAWRRDEEVEVELSSAETDVDAGAVTLTAKGPTGGSTSLPLSPCAGSSSPFCRRAKLQLWSSSLEMAVFRGKVAVSASAEDVLGNKSSKSLDVPVTRWKWSMDPDPAASVKQIKTAPAVGKTGTIYLGTSHGLAVAVKPDGTKAWSFNAGGPIDASVVVADVNGKETAFVAGLSAGKGAIWGITADNAATSPAPLASYGTRVAASPAFLFTEVSAPPALPTLAAVFNNGASSRLFAIRIDAAGAPEPIFIALSAESESTTGLAAYGNTVVFGDKLGNLQSYSLGKTGVWALTEGWPVTIGAGTRATNPLLMGSTIAGGADGTTGRFFSVGRAGGTPAVQTWTVPVGNTSATATALLAGDDSHRLLFAVAGLGAPPTEVQIGGPLVGAPAVGQDGSIYVVTKTPEVRAVTSTGLPVWTVAIGGSSVSSPALDCSRSTTGTVLAGRPGVVYVGADDGLLYAFVTDSRGLDTASPWPKFHRDPGNTANADLPRAPACD